MGYLRWLYGQYSIRAIVMWMLVSIVAGLAVGLWAEHTWIIIAAMGCGVGVLLILARPTFALMILTAAYFANSPPIRLLGIPAKSVILFFGMTSLIATPERRQAVSSRLQRLIREPFVWWYGLFTAMVIISIMTHSRDLVVLRQVVNTVIVLTAVYCFVASPSAARHLLLAGLWGSAIAAIGGIYSYLQLPVHFFPPKGVSGFYGTEVTLAFSSMTGLFVALSLYSHGRRRWWVVLPMLPTALVVASVTSRGATMAFLAALVVRRVVKYPRLGGALLLIVLLCGVVGVMIYPDLGFYGGELQLQDVDHLGEISSGRVYLYLAALKLFRQHPIVGCGWETFRKKWLSYVGVPFGLADAALELDVHCSPLQVLTELGIVGFAVYVLWTVFFWKRVWRYWRVEFVEDIKIDWLLTALAGVWIHGMVDNVAMGFNRIHMILVVLVLAVIADQQNARMTGSR